MGSLWYQPKLDALEEGENHSKPYILASSLIPPSWEIEWPLLTKKWNSNLFNHYRYGRGHNNQSLAFQWSLVSSLLWQKSRPFNGGPWNKRCSLCATVQLEWVATGSVGFFKGKLGSKWRHGDPEWLRWLYYITNPHRLVFFSWGYISPFLVIPNLVLYHKNL